MLPDAPVSKLSKKVFFEYIPGASSFQLGYLGANKSTIEGILRLRYTDDKPILAKKITLSFVGKEYVHFAGTLEEGQDNDESDDEGVSTTAISIHTAKRPIFSSKIVIWRSQSKGHYESVKYLDLPFKFNLPDNLPPSVLMDKGCGRIYYILKAAISRQKADNFCAKKKFIKNIVPIVRHKVIPQPKLINWLKKEEGLAKLHVLGYDVSVNRSIFSPGESIIIPVKLFFNEPQVYLKNIFVGLKEYHELRTNRYETIIKNYIVENTVNADTIQNSSGSDNEYFVEVELNIPPAKQIVYGVDSTYITVSHKLKVKVSLGRAPDLHLSNIVSIENLISKDEAFPPPPPTVSTTQEVKEVIKPVVKPKRESFRRLSPFFPLYNKVQIQNVGISTKRNSVQPSNITYDSKKPNVIYNSRRFNFSPSKTGQPQRYIAQAN